MNTPIWDFANRYANSSSARFHMPGHKGTGPLGFEQLDITEFDGADSLFCANGIIKESEANATKLFGTGATFYSCEGSSLSVRAMLYLAMTNKAKNQGNYVLAARNAHFAFISASSLLGFDVSWLDKGTHLSCIVTADDIEKALSRVDKMPFALYLTSPDYLGNILDIENIAKVCKRYGVPLLVDNAHGSYLKFLERDIHPISLGADMCCDSAHKTLPVLTGGGYLHIANGHDEYIKGCKDAMRLFASTSPSYLILSSLDLCNKYLNDGFKNDLEKACSLSSELKKWLNDRGFLLVGNETIKITISTKDFGYYGYEIARVLKDNSVFAEFYDKDYVVLMISAKTTHADIEKIKNALLKIQKKDAILSSPIKISLPEKRFSIREAMLMVSEEIDIDKSLGRILANSSISCPPAVSLINPGEVFNESIIKACKYYGIKKVKVIKN